MIVFAVMFINYSKTEWERGCILQELTIFFPNIMSCLRCLIIFYFLTIRPYDYIMQSYILVVMYPAKKSRTCSPPTI